jgi:hypothetical protein
MALANVAELLAERGLRVLMIDFDLEAPGLERFFDNSDSVTPAAVIPGHRGVIDLLVSHRDLQALPPVAWVTSQGEAPSRDPSRVPLRDFVVPIRDSTSGGGSVLLLPAGRRAGTEYTAYAERVRSFDWDEFYTRWDGEEFFDWFREEAERLADVVLLDSRTGITELSGVCTFQLADVVLMFIAPNQQNLDGCRLIAESLSAPDLISKGRHGRELSILPVPSRVERSESDLLGWFAREFERQVGGFVPAHLRFENSLFIDLQIPYVPRYAFLETVAVREPGHPAASDIIAAYRRLVSAVTQVAPRRSRMYRALHGLGTPETGRVVEPGPDFVGRDWLLDRVNAWLDEPSAEPILLLTGEPGSGKTTALRWLASGAPEVPDRSGAGTRLHAMVLYAHECVATDEQTLDARYFVQALASRLATVLPDYGVGYGATRHPEIAVDLKENISATGPTGVVVVERIVVGDVEPQVAFDSLIRQPLLRSGSPGPLMLVLIDAAEQSLVSSQENSILDLLTYLTSTQLPAGLRLLVTSRSDPRVLEALDTDRLDLAADAPDVAADIREYAERRLAPLSQPNQTDLANRIARASNGNFLYARFMLDDVVKGQVPAQEADFQLVPASLTDFYNAEMKRLLGGRIERWDAEAPVFGVLAVEPTGFSSAQLAGITGRRMSEVNNSVRRWGQFLVSYADGRLRLYHRSFAQWLLENRTFQVDPARAHAAIGRYFIGEHKGAWVTCQDEFALEITVRHLLAALETEAAGTASREELLRELTGLFADRTFLEARIAKTGVDSLAHDIAATVAALLDKAAYPEASESLFREIRKAILTPPVDDGRPMADTLLSRTGSSIVKLYAENYQSLRDTQEQGKQRTAAMSNLVDQVRRIADLARWVPFDVDALMSRNPDERIIALAIWQARPEIGRFELLLDAISASRSAFEQYQALVVSKQILPLLDEAQQQALVESLHSARRGERGFALPLDSSRAQLIASLLIQLSDLGGREPRDVAIVLEPAPSGGFTCTVMASVTGRTILPITATELASAVDSVRQAMMSVVQKKHDGELVFQTGIDIPGTARDSALHTLARAGARLFQQLFLHPAAGADARIIGEWLRDQAMDPACLLKVQVVASQVPLPWAMLYLADASEGAQLDWNYFLGMRHIIEQMPLEQSLNTRGSQISSEPSLTVSLNVNTSIDKAQGITLVADHKQRWWDTAAARPGLALVSRSTKTEVVRALADSATGDQIMYFFAPATANADPHLAEIIMGPNDRVSLADLNLDAPTTIQLAGNPLVFMNVGSAGISSLFYNGFVPYFMAKGARGVIGTEFATPVLFAIEWANAFFDRFLDGTTVGETVLTVRQDFLREHGNPLGLIYAVHCDSDTRVAPPVGRLGEETGQETG